MIHTQNGLNNIEMTDPEIRGGIDGFVLGSSITALLQNMNTVRLSQVLDMYYTARVRIGSNGLLKGLNRVFIKFIMLNYFQNGVLDPTRRACNRQTLSQEVIQTNNLVAETLAFTAALDTYMPLRGTIIGGLEQPVNSAVNNLQAYTRKQI